MRRLNKVRLFWLCFGFGLVAPLTASAAANEGEATWPVALANQGFKPGRVVWPGAPILEAERGLAPLELLGLTLSVDGKRLGDAPWRFREGSRVSFDLFMRRTGPVPSSAKLELRIVGTHPAFRKTLDLPSPLPELGVVAKQTATMLLYRKRYSGDAVLEANLVTAPDLRTPLYTAPIHIMPIFLGSSAPEERLSEFFGQGWVRLNTAFRLGPGARIDIPLPDRVEGPVARLGVVSYIAYDPRFPQDEPMCRVTFLDAVGNPVGMALVRMGRDTAINDYDRFEDDKLDHEKPPVFDVLRRVRVETDQADQVISQYTYGARIPLDQPVRAASLRVEYLQPAGLIDVVELLVSADAEDVP